MSHFVTPLNSIIQSALGKLPNGASIEEVRLTPDKKGIEVVWKHDDFKTGYVTPFEWTEEMLARGAAPAGVKLVRPITPDADPIPMPITPERIANWEKDAPENLTKPASTLPLKVDKSTKKSVKSK